ncbi:protein kinase domain-containing protein [Arthroderma uncinatum]|uniref:protein kinase domain-containing protein n=1 Tax=Arthroderma uncinatum TaxID=74035 RepID=UPI00144A4D57|nr:protein kinase domain-containing protein [Arthroderma uncinatum]KAF3483390.1 protein kinase domain-containing protein [Arthroderma uncinatum]
MSHIGYPDDRDPKIGQKYFDDMCSDMQRRFVIYGKIGKGTFGQIYAAREINPPPSPTNTDTNTGSGSGSDSDSPQPTGGSDNDGPRTGTTGNDRPRQFAIKMELQTPLSRATKYQKAPTCLYRETSTGAERLLPVEAIVLQLLTQCDRFPKLDSVYIHREFSSIVMSADSVDDDPLRGTLPQLKTVPTHLFPGYNGEQLMYWKTTRITEIQACKIASHLLEAIVYLMDMKMMHGDLSHRNYILDKNLNAQLIDFGAVYAAERDGWMTDEYGYIEAFEYFVNPEIALAFATSGISNPRDTLDDRMLVLDHDIRVQNLWKFGVLVYDLLHGYSPWETPERHPHQAEIKELHDWSYDDDEKYIYLYDRRVRIMNEELPIDERLSQDCVDALRHLLARDICDRMKLADLQNLPWFQGHWVDHHPSELARPPRRAH